MTLTYVGSTFGPNKNMSHDHDPATLLEEIDEWSKQFTVVAIILAQMKQNMFLPNLNYIIRACKWNKKKGGRICFTS